LWDFKEIRLKIHIVCRENLSNDPRETPNLYIAKMDSALLKCTNVPREDDKTARRKQKLWANYATCLVNNTRYYQLLIKNIYIFIF
jgi:hypothetical protein